MQSREGKTSLRLSSYRQLRFSFFETRSLGIDGFYAFPSQSPPWPQTSTYHVQGYQVLIFERYLRYVRTDMAKETSFSFTRDSFGGRKTNCWERLHLRRRVELCGKICSTLIHDSISMWKAGNIFHKTRIRFVRFDGKFLDPLFRTGQPRDLNLWGEVFEAIWLDQNSPCVTSGS